jgi:hypothetical protein
VQNPLHRSSGRQRKVDPPHEVFRWIATGPPHRLAKTRPYKEWFRCEVVGRKGRRNCEDLSHLPTQPVLDILHAPHVSIEVDYKVNRTGEYPSHHGFRDVLAGHDRSVDYRRKSVSRRIRVHSASKPASSIDRTSQLKGFSPFAQTSPR